MPLAIRPLSAAERLDWLRLIRSENVGPITFYRLLERFGSASDALAALPDLAKRGGRAQPLRLYPKAEAERELRAAEKLGVRLIAACEPDYPAPLTGVDDAPPLLSVLGHAGLLQRPAVGVVGARNASTAGKRMANELSRELAAAGFLVVSGLARGIDTAAHAGALDGGTAAVMAGGVDIIYPPENDRLHAAIAERGVLVAECAVGTEPQARHFPRRNRLISGLSLGVLVVEAALKSGSLITARLALEQGRELFAVPGSPADPRAQGCNRLIKEGAHLVENADDVIHVLRSTPAPMREPDRDLFRAAPPAPPDEAELARARSRILESLSPTPVLIDEVVRDCQLSPAVVMTVLLELELAGRAQRHPGGRVSIL